MILGHVPLRDLAHAAPACREFHERVSGRMAEERTRLVCVAEQVYGKKMFYGFVNAFRRSSQNPDVYPGLLPEGENTLFINEAGEPELVRMEDKWTTIDVDHFLLISKGSAHHVLAGELWADFPAFWARVFIDAEKTGEGALEWTVDGLGETGREAAVGLLLALCGEDLRSSWPPSLKSVTLGLWGLSGDEGKKVAETLVGPLRFLPGYVVCEDRSDTWSKRFQVVVQPL